MDDSKRKSHFIQEDLDRLRGELQNEIKSKEEIKHELWTSLELRKKSEDELNALA